LGGQSSSREQIEESACRAQLSDIVLNNEEWVKRERRKGGRAERRKRSGEE